ncbi:hypothetical protein [Nannocystis pusilla]|uniref:hypothetical protein n=1 Tax=Nannocystis pusilla TaxID=889268 RepID=UPI003DA4EB88
MNEGGEEAAVLDLGEPVEEDSYAAGPPVTRDEQQREAGEDGEPDESHETMVLAGELRRTRRGSIHVHPGPEDASLAVDA